MSDHDAHVARAEAFRRLHEQPEPLRLVNAWDALSARVFAKAGAPAIGTSSFAVAASLGYQDGQHVPWPTVRRVTGEIVEAAGEVPVTVDIEAGGGAEPADVVRTVADVVAAGAVGVNLEDANPEVPGTLFDVDDQCRRLSAARAAAEEQGVPLYVNARCDTYFSPAVEPAQRLDETLKRTAAYLAAGADGIFLPGLVDAGILRTVVASVGAPVNVMVWPGLPPADELGRLGVKRISQGGAMFLLAVGFLERSTRAFLDGPWEHTGGDVAPALHLVGQLVHRA
jgi:2-methylisocitrate lyase-like PEP mutase family enzyme